MAINKLTKEVDVYCKWIDLCEDEQKKIGGQKNLGFQGEEENYFEEEKEQVRGRLRPSHHDDDEDDDEEEFDFQPTLRKGDSIRMENKPKLVEEEAEENEDSDESNDLF